MCVCVWCVDGCVCVCVCVCGGGSIEFNNFLVEDTNNTTLILDMSILFGILKKLVVLFKKSEMENKNW